MLLKEGWGKGGRWGVGGGSGGRGGRKEEQEGRAKGRNEVLRREGVGKEGG